MTRPTYSSVLAVLAIVATTAISQAQDADQPRRIPISPKKQQSAADSAAAPAEDTLAAATAVNPDSARIWYEPPTEALNVARRDKRQILVIFETEWCNWCKAMSESTWTDDGLLKLATTIVFTRADGDIDTALVSRYRVNRYPTVVLASDQGVEVDRFVGYFGPREMQEELTRALEGTDTMWELDRKLNESRNDPKILLQITREFIERNEPDRAKEYVARIKSSDPNGDFGAADDALYIDAMIERNDRNWYKALEHLKQLVKKYPESEWREDAELYIPWLLAQAGDDEEALNKYNEFLDTYGSSSETQWVKRQIAKLEPEPIPTEVPTKPEGQ